MKMTSDDWNNMKKWFKAVGMAAAGGAMTAFFSTSPGNPKEMGKAVALGALTGISYLLNPNKNVTTQTTVLGATTEVNTVTKKVEVE